MKIGIDAYSLSDPFNGIGQVTTHCLRSLQRIGPGTSDAPELSGARAALNALAPEGCEFFLYMGVDSGGNLPDRFHKRILPLQFGSRPLSKKWWEMRQLPAAVRADRCDLLISLYQSAAVMPRAFPHLMLVHDIIYCFSPQFKSSVGKRVELWTLLRGIRRATHCAAVSNFTKHDMEQHLGMSADCISVAHIAADPGFASRVTEKEIADVLLKYQLAAGYLYHGGGLHERKNAGGVLEAYALLLQESRAGKFPGALPRLVISGKLMSGIPYASDVEAIAHQLKIADHVTFLGQVPQEDLPALYKAASVFLYPSCYEGFGLPILEAMHQGVPVVTANNSSLSEVGGEAVIYCDANKPAEIAAGVRSILADSALRVRLSEEGLKRARVFTWDAFMQNLLHAAAVATRRVSA